MVRGARLWSRKSPRKVVRSRPGFGIQRLENSVHPAIKGFLFRSREGHKATKEEGWAPLFTCCAPDSVVSNFHFPYSYWVVANLNLLFA